MLPQDRFPHELLSQPKEVRLAYFRNKVIAHPRLKEVHQALIHKIHRPGGVSLILVLGPTGVGKTILRLRIEKQLVEEALPELEEDRGRIPVVGVEAVAPTAGNFSWKDYYTRALLALDEPLMEHKVNYDVRGVRRDGIGRLVVGHNVATLQLRWTIERCLHHRRPAAFIVDEAQHFKKMAGGRRLLDQMDTIKSLASTTGTVHVLIGTYELLGLANLSGQLSRRSVEIHFPRYRPHCAEDGAAFKSVLLTFQRHLPLEEAPDLVGRYEYFYERSVGCVGVLKSWLDRALVAALEDEQTTLTDAVLERHAEPTRKLLRMAREIKEGEEALKDRVEDQIELRTLLGMKQETSRDSVSEAGKARKQPQTEAGPQRRVGRVGQRKASRDLVGMGEHAG